MKNSNSYSVIILAIFVLTIVVLLSMIQAISLQNLVDQERNILIDVIPTIEHLEKTNKSINKVIESGIENNESPKILNIELTKINTRASNILLVLSQSIINTDSGYKFQSFLKQREILKRIEHELVSLLKYGNDNERLIATQKKWRAVNNNIRENVININKDLRNESEQIFSDIKKARNSIIVFLSLSVITIILMSISIVISLRRSSKNKPNPIIEDIGANIESILSSSRDALLIDIARKQNEVQYFAIIFAQISSKKNQNKISEEISLYVENNSERTVQLYSYQKDEYVFVVEGMKTTTEVISFSKQLLIDFKKDNTTVSIGGACYPETSNNADSVLNSAIRAMHTSKSSETGSVKITV